MLRWFSALLALGSLSVPLRPHHGHWVSLGVMDTTSYCQSGRTASGEQTYAGEAAGNLWPFGTRLWIQHYGEVVVEDRIGWGSQLDVFMASCQAADEYGRRYVEVKEWIS